MPHLIKILGHGQLRSGIDQKSWYQYNNLAPKKKAIGDSVIRIANYIFFASSYWSSTKIKLIDWSSLFYLNKL